MHGVTAPPEQRGQTYVHVIFRETAMEAAENKNTISDKHVPVLLASILVISACAILYELLISTLSSYFWGSSILQFSITIGVFLSSMGLGAYLSRFITTRLLERFIVIEIWLALLGGSSALILNAAYTLTQNYYLIAIGLIILLGTLIGLEIPLLTRILRSYKNLRNTIANVLSFDYLGALLASLVFPFLLLPYLGVMKTSFVVGLLNLAVAAYSLFIFRREVQKWGRKIMATISVFIALLGGFVAAVHITGFFEKFVYQDEIIYTAQSPYQKIVLTRWKDDIRLFLNGNLQFSSVDEYRYHEPLVHIPMLLAGEGAKNVLLLGAGDGLAARDLLQHYSGCKITIVDLDKAVTDICASHPLITGINQNALKNPAVTIVNDDAFNFIKNSNTRYDVVLIDLPDPHDPGLSKLYSREFYELVRQSLAVGGVVVTQATSPFFATKPFWCIHNTMGQVFKQVVAYHTQVPSFGMWGFQMAYNLPQQMETVASSDSIAKHIAQKFSTKKWSKPLQYLNAATIPSMFVFENDVDRIETKVNTLDNHALLHYYEDSWKRFNP